MGDSVRESLGLDVHDRDEAKDTGAEDVPALDYTFDNFDDLDITTTTVDLEEIGDDLEVFQQDEIVSEALLRGVDLRNYSQQIEVELRRREIGSIADYIGEAENIASLNSEIGSCEEVLVTMEHLLQGFQENLSDISSEIRHLQDKSLEMNVQLQNRNHVATKLTLFLDNVAVSESFIHVVCEGDINDSYVETLKQLSSKITYTAQRTPLSVRELRDAAQATCSTPLDDFGIDPSQTKAGRDAIPQLERLRVKAVTRVRAFLLRQIAALRRPKTNVQMVQEHTLLRFKYLMQFIAQHAPEVSAEVRTTYVETMGKTLANLFKSYHSALRKLCIKIAGKGDVVAVEQNAVKGLFSSRVDLSKRKDTFALGDRARILDDPDAPAIIVHIAQAEKQKFPYEVLFRSMQRHLMDSATSEFSFAREFLAGSDASRPDATAIFYQVFAPALSLCLENLEDYLFSSHDAVGLLLMIHITNSHRRVMQSRRVPVLDTYFDRVNMLVWPRFKAIFDLNMKSLRVANPKRLGTIELQPHYVSRRYAQFASSMRLLHDRLQSLELSDGMLVQNISLLRTEFVGLLRRLAAEHSSSKERAVFLTNNFDLVIGTFEEQGVDSGDQAFFTELVQEQIQLYINEELAETFGRMQLFVQQTATVATSDDATAGAGSGVGAGGSAAPKVDAAVVEALVMDFEANWKAGIEKIHANVMAYFSNFKNGVEILQKALTQLLMLYTRFQDIIKATWPTQPPAFTRHMVSLTTAFFEIKKVSRNKF